MDRILGHLPEPVGRVLFFGASLGSLLPAARERGHQATGACPDPAQHALAAERCGEDALLPPCPWEVLALEDDDYVGIVVHEALRYLDPLTLFGKAYRALADDGALILVDELVTADLDRGYNGWPRLRYLLPLAERCGFALQAREDLLDEAAAECQADNRRDHDNYTQGRCTCLLLRFQKRRGLRWRVSHVDARDIPAVSDLFRRVFQQEMSRDLWDWKYGRGRGQGSIAWAGERIVAHYGGMTRPILYFGRPESACQVGDVMVDPAERGFLTRKGPFFLTAASLPEACSGFGAKHLIGFGFPNARAMQVAVRLGLYAEAGRIVELHWSAAGPSRPSLLTRLRRIMATDAADLDRIVVPLWRAMSSDLRDAIVGLRDADWLRYRYLSHPHHDYHLMLVAGRITGRPCGIVVLRKDGSRCELLDVVAPLKRLPLLVREARRIAGQWQSSELYCWVSARYAPLFERCGGERRELNVATPASIWTEAPRPEELRDRWWLTGGDTDFH